MTSEQGVITRLHNTNHLLEVLSTRKRGGTYLRVTPHSVKRILVGLKRLTVNDGKVCPLLPV